MRRIVMVYFMLEGSLLLAFWVWVLSDEAAITQFATPGSAASLRMFVYSDIGLLATSALVSAWMIGARARMSRAAAWLHSGAALYAGVCAWGGWVEHALTLLAALTMVPLMIGAVCVSMWIERAEHRR